MGSDCVKLAVTLQSLHIELGAIELLALKSEPLNREYYIENGIEC